MKQVTVIETGLTEAEYESNKSMSDAFRAAARRGAWTGPVDDRPASPTLKRSRQTLAPFRGERVVMVNPDGEPKALHGAAANAHMNAAIRHAAGRSPMTEPTNQPDYSEDPAQ